MLDMQTVPTDAPETHKGPMLPPPEATRSSYRKYKPIDNDRFIGWLRAECTVRGIRNWAHLAEKSKLIAEAEAARHAAAGEPYDIDVISASSLSNIENNKRRLADDGARAIARALGMNAEEEVILFRMAGILSSSVPSEEEEAASIASKLKLMPPGERENMLSIINTMVVLSLRKNG